jgi:hypothetical protein
VELPLVFSYSADGQIFRLLADARRGQLAVEVRHPARREASFAALDLRGPILCFDGLGLDEPWFCGMSALAGGRLYLHTYPDQRHPDPKGIIAVDLAQAAIVWEQPDWYLDQAGPDYVCAYRLGPDGREEVLLAAATGQSVIQPAALAEAQPEASPASQPARYPADSPQFVTVAQFLAQRFGWQAMHEIHYLELNEKIIVHVYRRAAGQLTGELLVLQASTGQVLLQAGHLVQGLVGEPFLAMPHHLVWLEGAQSLKIYAI